MHHALSHQADKDFAARRNVFHDSRADQALTSEEKVYGLRARCCMRHLPVAITDEDTSGDYDPAHSVVNLELDGVKRKRPSPDHDRSRLVAEEVARARTFQAANKTKSTLSALAARQNGKILEVIIPFLLGSVGHAYLATIRGSGPNRWYPEDDESWIVFTKSADIWQIPSNEEDDSSIEPYRLRKRVLTPKDCRDSHTEGLTGHPEARGCWGCREHGQRCSLLDAGAYYPCESCFEDGHDCELVRQPSQKLACEHCKTKKYFCSFALADGDHNADCAQCHDRGFKCYACPAPVSIRIGDDGKPVIRIVPRTALKVQIHESVEERLAAALAADARLGRRKSRAQKKEILNKKKQKTDQASSRDTQPLREWGTITTHFAHPMTFMAPLTGGSCHFCSIPLHSHFGWGLTTVTIAMSADGKSSGEPGSTSSQLACPCISWPCRSRTSSWAYVYSLHGSTYQSDRLSRSSNSHHANNRASTRSRRGVCNAGERDAGRRPSHRGCKVLHALCMSPGD